MLEARLTINNNDADASDSAHFERNDAHSGKVVTPVAYAKVADAESAANAAAAAFPEWAKMPPTERRKILLKGADLLESRVDDFAASTIAETGATEHWARYNVQLGAAILREAASMTTQVTGDVIPADREGTLSMAIRQPVGVVLGIAPWNAAVTLGVRAIAAPLACGNTAILKASELCPQTHRLIGEVLCAAGLPEGVLSVITNAPDDAKAVVDALIEHPTVRRVNFTGSTRVGHMIAETCARYFKPCVLELGGKAPLLVLADADLDEAVKATAFGAFMNQGQICMSTERVIVDDSVADLFVDKLTAKTATMKAGGPQSGSVLGSLVSAEAAMRVKNLVDDAVAKGASLRVGGKVDGSIMEATVLDHVTSAMTIYKEESFGPVVSVIRTQTVDEAVSIANDTEYGLSAAIFSRDVSRALEIAQRIESGICHINGPTLYDEAQMPFGGIKDSGYGRMGGKAGLEEFTELRWITIQTKAQDYPI